MERWNVAAITLTRTASPRPDRLDRRILLILAAIVFTLSFAGAGTILLSKKASSAGLHATPAVRADSVTYARLPAMSFTLNDGTRLRELQLRVVLEMDPTVTAKSVELYFPQIADAMSLRMLDVDPEELRGAEGPIYVKDALRFAAAKVLRPLKVRQVLVQDMLLR